MSSPLNIIFAGSGEFGVPTLRALVAAGHRVVRVFTQPDRPAGRGKKLTPTPIAELATSLSLDVVRTADINIEPLPSADVMVVIAFGQKISEAVVHHPRLGSVNLHASVLPKYRGAAPINWAIINGDEITGNSIIRLANKMDAGAVLAESELVIGESETAGELHDRLSADGAPLMLRVLNELALGTAIEKEQDHARATIAPKLSRETANIDWWLPAYAIARRINGLSPWPGCRVRLMDGDDEIAKLTLVRARPINKEFEKEQVRRDVEQSIASELCKHFDAESVNEFQVKLEPSNMLSATRNGMAIDAALIGRIGAKTVKDFMMRLIDASADSRTSGVIRADGSVSSSSGNAVDIVELQPEGKRPMSLKEFRNGRPWRAGMRLESIV